MKKILVIGNFTKDRIHYGNIYKEGIGGPPYYISKVLSRYKDVKLIIISSVGEDFPEDYLADLCSKNIECIIDKFPTKNITFTNVYENGKRIQMIEGGEYRIVSENIESINQVDYVILSPVYNEIEYKLLYTVKLKYRNAVDPQGFLRRVYNRYVRLVSPEPTLFKGIDLFKPSKDEFKVLTDNYRLVESFKKMIGGHVVVTNGIDGSYLLEGYIYHIPSYEIRDVDTTGAGDMYLGLVVYYIIKGFDILNSCVYSTALVSMYLQNMDINHTLLMRRVRRILNRIHKIKYTQLVSYLESVK